MRKFLLIGLLAFPLVALTERPASAWCKFGASINFSCGGNKCYRDGGNPPPECFSIVPNCCAPACPAPCLSQGPIAKPATAAVPQYNGVQQADYQQMQNYWNAYQQQAAYYNAYGYYYPGAYYGAYQYPYYYYGN